MKITIIGPGAIGLVLASSLENKNEVSILVKRNRYDELNRKGLWIIKNDDKKEVRAKIVTEISDCDIVIIAVKGYDLDITNELLKDFNGKIIICQNGLKMMDYNPSNNNEVFAIVTSLGAGSLDEGVSEFKGTGTTVIGGLKNIMTNSNQLVNIFSTDYFKIIPSENIEEHIWLKAVVNSAINPIASHYNIKNGELKKEKYWKLVKELLDESINIAISNNIHFPMDPVETTKKIIHNTAENFCSMLQDLKKGKKTEINEINGILLQIGQKKKVSTLLNGRYLEKIKFIS